MKKLFTLLLLLMLICLVTVAQPNYTFNSGTTSMSYITGTAFTSWTGTADDGFSSAENIGFTFTYDGTAFTQFQVSTNGFLQFGNTLAAATPTDALNSTLRNVLAPLWDDLSVSATSDITYELSGSSGSYVLTVEWKNVKWNKSAASANAEFQIKLYEADGKIEFIYGTMGTPNAGAASIGLNDATASGTWGTFQSINVGGGGTNFHVSMVYVFNSIATAPASNTVLTFTPQTVAPMSGTYTVGGTSPDFATLSIAAQALNLNGISGAVTLNIRSGTYDDIIHLINVAGTSSTNTITIQKESGTVTLSPRNGSRSGSSSTTADFVVALLGTDYTTLDGIDIQHNSLNNGSTGNAQFEFGYWLSNFSAGDGAQYNTIKNTHIVNTTLGSNPTNFRGIRTSTGGFVAATSAAGTCSYNTIKNVKIDTTSIAIYLSGQSVTIPDIGYTITADGGYSGGNTTGYNDIGNITINTTAASQRGIYFDGQDSITIEKTEVRNISNTNTTGTADMTGIGMPTATSVKVATIQNNLIHGLTAAATATQVVYGIWQVTGTTVYIKGNKIYDLQNGSTGTTGTVRAIMSNNSTSGTTTHIINNLIYDLRNPTGTASNYSVRCIELNSDYNVNMYNNTLYLNQASSGTGAVATACLYIATSGNLVLDMRNNILVNKSAVTSSSSSRAICLAKTTPTIGTQIASTTNNNIFYAGTADTKHLVAWDATTGYQTLTAYQTWMGSPREVNSIVADPGFVDDVSPGYDLQPSTSSWVVNGQGAPISSVTTDIAGNSRSTSLADGPVDMGAFEYTPTGSASTTESGTIADGNTTTYTGVDLKTVVQITWNVGTGTLPTSVVVTYTPGKQAENTINPSIYRAFTITPTGGSAGWNADVKLYYNGSTELKGFTESSMRIAKYDGSGTSWSTLSTTITDASDYGQVNVTDFSTFSFDDGTNPLPVELTSFTAVTRGQNVELRWSTATEVNNYGFEVERAMMNDELGMKKWMKVGFVEGSGNSNAPKEYSFTDKAGASGTYSYRLKQIDRDGRFEYSPTVEVVMAHVAQAYTLEQNYPNPFNPTTTIRFSVPAVERATVTVYDITGREVAVLFNDVANPGQMYNVQFTGKGLASGIYIYVLQTPTFREVKKMQMIK
jgi:hypothetical protein